MVMIVSTAGMMGRGRVDGSSAGMGSWGGGLHGYANYDMEKVETIADDPVERARRVEKQAAKQRRLYQARKARRAAQGLTSNGKRRMTDAERKGINK